MIIGIDASRAATEQRTGTEAYARELIRHLAPLATANGHTVRLYFNQPASQPLTDAPHDAVVIPFPRLWTHVRLAAELHQSPPDVFFTPAHVIPVSYFGRSVATVHDLGYLYYPDAHTRQQVAYLRWSTRHNATRSHAVLADSHATKADLCTRYHIAASKITVVYPPLSAETVPSSSSSDNTPAVQSPYFLFVGTLQPRKNLVRLVAAFNQIAHLIPHQLVLAGKQGWRSTAILAAVAQSPFRQRIQLPGFLSEQAKTTVLKGATALLFPSLYEGFGFPVLEAQRAGIPVLTANTSSLPEVAGDGALLISPEDSESLAGGMLQLAVNAPLRQRLAALGCENVKRFDGRVSAAAALATLEQATR